MKSNPDLLKLKYSIDNNRSLLVDSNTDICIGGYPRSGNTFTTVLLSELTKNEIQIAHHTHSIANLKLALKYNVPTLVLIRDPLDSLASWAIRTNKLTIENMLQEYINYYNYIQKHCKDFLILSFDTLTSDLNKTLIIIDEYFGFKIKHKNYESINELQNHIFDVIDNNSNKWNGNKEKWKSIAIPNQKRKKAKDKFKQQIKNLKEYSYSRELYKNIINSKLFEGGLNE